MFQDPQWTFLAPIMVKWIECSLQETWFQSQVASYQKLLKWYLIPPCLTLSIIRYVSRLKWSNPGKGVAPSLTPQCSSYWKGSFLVALDYGHQLYFTYTEHSIYYFILVLDLWHTNHCWLFNAISCFFIYIRYFIHKHILLILTNKWLNSSISKNSILHKSTKLNGCKYRNVSLTIQLNISHLFKRS